MRAVRAHHTGPELAVPRLLTDLGLRYRLHRRDLPGSPDVAFIGRRVALFVHGCFWHGHACRRGARVPQTRTEYWRAKIDRNRARDADVALRLQASGWREVVVWECELKDRDALYGRLAVDLDVARPKSIGLPLSRRRAAPLTPCKELPRSD